MWADWIGGRSTGRLPGDHAVPPSSDAEEALAGSLATISRSIAILLSPRYLQSPPGRGRRGGRWPLAGRILVGTQPTAHPGPGRSTSTAGPAVRERPTVDLTRTRRGAGDRRSCSRRSDRPAKPPDAAPGWPGTRRTAVPGDAANPLIWMCRSRNAVSPAAVEVLEQLRDQLLGGAAWRSCCPDGPATASAAWARPRWRWSTRTGSWPTTTWSGGSRAEQQDLINASLAPTGRQSLGIRVRDIDQRRPPGGAGGAAPRTPRTTAGC